VDHPIFAQLAEELCGTLAHAVLIDSVVYSYEERQQIFNLLEEHIRNNIIKVSALRIILLVHRQLWSIGRERFLSAEKGNPARLRAFRHSLQVSINLKLKKFANFGFQVFSTAIWKPANLHSQSKTIV